jgi:site-specific DNA-methyltransferase (adenine-specific)
MLPTPYLDKVFCCDALDLLARLPSGSVASILADPMYGVAPDPSPRAAYDWGPDHCRGDPEQWWAYHRPIYEQCRRVLRPVGTLAWAMGCKFRGNFRDWFGGHRIWPFSRYKIRGVCPFGHIWVVQSREQEPIRYPDRDGLIIMGAAPKYLKVHPCPKAVEEMQFLADSLSRPGDIVLDPFCGSGSTLVAAKKLGRHYIGCDLSEKYCRLTKYRLSLVN